MDGDFFIVGEKVRKVGGDYTFEGTVVAVFFKRGAKALRYVVEDERGLLLIHSAKTLERAVCDGEDA